MRTIGFDGGSSLYELGPASDVILFFQCLDVYAVKREMYDGWSLLTDRLYRRYVRMVDNERTSFLMDRVQSSFEREATDSAIDWNNFNSDQSWLEPSRSTLADLFSRYFEGFSRCIESAKLNYETFKEYSGYSYEPVRIVISDLTGFARDKNKSLGEYDALEGQPFWLQ
jgi:hypothetical protein